jgi:uncharacterized repeat protein (TIGR01451 family)
MADVKLSNIANVTGNYDSIPTTLTSEAVITEMIAGLTIVKVADKQNWASGNLTYTITITNGAENAFENPVITDILDPALIKLVEDSVEVDGKKVQYTYNDVTGELSITLETIEKEASAVITFQVQKV